MPCDILDFLCGPNVLVAIRLFIFMNSSSLCPLSFVFSLKYLPDTFSQYKLASFPIFAFQSPCMTIISRLSVSDIVDCSIL